MQNTIEIPKQVEYFKEYRKRLELAIGKERTDNLIKKAIFVISAGTNDLVVNYFTLPVRRKSYTISGYQHFLMQHVEQLIQVCSTNYGYMENIYNYMKLKLVADTAIR